jgi:uncharacterized protein DUF4440
MTIPRYVAVSAWLAISLLALPIADASGQTTATGRVPTVSRLVMQFTEREIQLAEHLRARNAGSAGNLLTDDFELRASNQPGRPVPRADWLAQSMQSASSESRVTQMAVHDLGETAVVSFLQGADTTPGLFVVDVWRRVGSDWKLSVRYAAPTAGNVPIPGFPPAEPNLPKKY